MHDATPPHNAAPPTAQLAAPDIRNSSDRDMAPSAGITMIEPVPSKSRLTIFLIAACAISMLATGLLWVKLSNIQEALARQSADTASQSVEARTLAKTAQELAQQTAARQATMDTRLSEVALQRSQLDDLMQSLSRSRDENLVVDIDSALRLAQQQAQLTGSIEPLLAALKSADLRLVRAAQPRLNPLLRAIAKDIDRVKAASLADTPGLLVKLDELSRLVDEAPLGNQVGANQVGANKADSSTTGPTTAFPLANGNMSANNPAAKTAKKQATTGKNTETDADNATKKEAASAISAWAWGFLTAFKDEARNLVRVSRIESPEAVLLSPEQGYFVRQNLKLRVLNARLGLLARQPDASRADLVSAAAVLDKYFDSNARVTQQAAGLLQQLQTQLRATELPRIDDTLAALTTAAAGR